jgi:hypothetical protein
MVAGHEPQRRSNECPLVLAQRMDRTIISGFEEPVRARRSDGVSSPKRLGRLLMALTVALAWLTLMALPEVVGAMPRRGYASDPGAPSEVTEVGVLKPVATMSLKNSTQHASDSLLPTARCKSTLRPSVVMHQAARTPSLAL